LQALKPYWKHLLISSSSAALYALLTGVTVWMAGPLLTTLFEISPDNSVSAMMNPGSSVTTPAGTAQKFSDSIKASLKEIVDQFVQAESREQTLWNFCVAIMLLVIIRSIFYYMQGFFIAYVQQGIVRTFRDQLFEKYQRLSLEYFHKRRTGEVISRVMNDVVVLNESIDVGFHQMVTDSVTVIVFLTFVLILSWKLTLLSLVVMPILFLFIWWIGRKMRKYSRRAQERMADVNSVLEESISNLRIVKAFSMEAFETRKFFASTYTYFKTLLKMTRVRHLGNPINDLLSTAAAVLILLYAGTRIIAGAGEMTAGDFMVFVLAMFALIKPLKSLTQIHVKLQIGTAAAQRIFDVFDAEETITDRPDAVTVPAFSDTLSFEHISFSYNQQEPVLEDVSFSVRKGEVVALVGPSGAGKSTLFNLVPRFYDPLEGAVKVDGRDIRTFTMKSLRSLMGIVTQETYLFNDTIRNNIAYGLETVTAEAVEQAARMANAHRFIEEFDLGYDTIVGNRGVRLSGGQRQRLAIARALLRNPEILLFDEATSSLDTESEMLVQEAIDRLMANRTTLVIAHRLSTIKHANTIVVLDKGRIVQSGTHDQLVEQDGLYRKLYMMQFRNDR
jgi:subfamily B ATP-binding cassette protein MsbA